MKSSTHKTLMTLARWIAWATLVLAVFVAVLALTGCTSISDGIASALGAPTTAQIDEAQQARDDSRRELATLQATVKTAKAQTTAADKAAADASQKADLVRQSISQVANQLAQAAPGSVAWDALNATLDGLRGQLSAVMTQADQFTQIAAKYQAKRAELAAAIQTQTAAIITADERLAAFGRQTDAAIDAAGASVRTLGETAQALGVPGAAPIAGAIGGAITGILGLIFGVRKSRQATATRTAALEVVGSIDTAAAASPSFKNAMDNVKPILDVYQSPAAKRLVDEAQGKVAA